jgi:nucleoside-diphosphate-sugar epimerase
LKILFKGATLDGAAFGDSRTLNLPGIRRHVRQMLDSLERITDKATVDRIQFKPDASINNIVSSWPGAIDNTRALQLGFKVDSNFDEFITQFIADNKQQLDVNCILLPFYHQFYFLLSCSNS